VKEKCPNPFTGELVDMVKPLFPRYIFAKFEANQMLHKINYTRGVHSVVGFGNGPVAVDENVIEMINSRIGEDGLVRIGDDINVGDRVLITNGPFKSLIGLFEHHTPASDRVMILLSAVSYQGHVSIEKDLIRKVS
jgi:transcriptional antiterminator RfaH